MKRKINFQDGHHGGHLGFLITMIFAISDLLVTPMLPTKFWVNWLFGLGEEVKYIFSRWPPWISDWNDLAIFDLQVTPMLPTKFGVDWPFSSGEEAKNRFSRWRPSWISDRNNFSYFWSTSHPNASYQVSSQLAQGCRWSRLLIKAIVDVARRTTNDGRWTDHNSSPWALHAQVS